MVQGSLQSDPYYLPDQNPSFVKRFFSWFFKTLFNSIQYVVLLSMLGIFLYFFVITPHIVEGSSMEPNFCSDDIYLSLKLPYFFKEYSRGDVIVYRYDEANSYIKRIVGIGGDRIKIQDGKVFRNGIEITEPYLPEGRQTKYAANPKMQDTLDYTVPAGQYFVLGDNRGNSNDSRFFLAMNPKTQSIDGKVIFVISPLKRFRVFDNNEVLPEDECRSSL